jgi:hypothetical protein
MTNNNPNSSPQIFYIIYKTTNLLNNKIYIGQHITSNLDDGYLGSGIAITKAISMHGRKNFKREILYFCESKEELNEKEREIVNEEFVKRRDTYNLVCGGQCDTKAFAEAGKRYMKNIKNDPEKFQEHKNKLSNGLKEKWERDGHNWTGKSHSEETKKKMSEKAKTHTGEKNSSWGSCWIYNEDLKESKKIKKDDLETWEIKGWKKGRKMFDLTDEQREKMGASTKGCFWITNGKISQRCFNENELPEGWWKGRTQYKNNN